MPPLWLFRLQKYKKFESNSQLIALDFEMIVRCFDCKSTKNLRAIHNSLRLFVTCYVLFRLQKYKKFESNSQHKYDKEAINGVVSTAKVQKI